MFYSFSDDTVYKRWLAPVPSMPHRNLLEYCKVDDVDNVAIVAEYQHRDTESEILGVGRYHLVPATGYADVGFVLRDDWQGLGLGTAMFRHIVEIAKQNGIAGLTGDVLMDNVAMIHTFHKAGLDVQSKLDGSIYRMKIPFARKSDATQNK